MPFKPPDAAIESGHMDFEQAYNHAEDILRPDTVDLSRLAEEDSQHYQALDLRDKIDTTLRKRRKLEERLQGGGLIEYKMGRIAEAITHEGAREGLIIRPIIQALHASEYDDTENGIDEIIEFEGSQRRSAHLGLGLDVTTGNIQDIVAKKVDRIKQQIDRNAFTRLYYPGGPIIATPVVVYIPRETLSLIIEPWSSGGLEAVAQHPLWGKLSQQIFAQSVHFKDYAEKRRRKEFVTMYNDALNAVPPEYRSAAA